MGRKVLIVQPSLQPPGGGNGVAAWILQALAHEHQVTVLSWSPVDIEPINRFFGTTLRSSEFDTIVVPRTWRAIPDRLPVPAALIRSGLLMRDTRRFTDRFDVIVGVHNETDYGRRGIQYVHYPTYLRPRPEVDFRWYHRAAPVLNSYYAFADWIADFSQARMKANLTLANSSWTASRVREFLGIEARTLYPPVVSGGTPLPWRERQRAFLAIGRISPEKEYERIIRILALVRRRVPDVALDIVGTWDRHTRGYYQRLESLAASLTDGASWVRFHHNLTRHDVQSLIARSRYGIHGMREEHFGMAPAEMMLGGMVVWVPNGGGQVEIVGSEPALVYNDEESAAHSIASAITNPTEEARLREYLASRYHLFNVDRFIASVQQIVADFRE
jgi:glycosyltransferase involved in cell wall biosynthesis